MAWETCWFWRGYIRYTLAALVINDVFEEQNITLLFSKLTWEEKLDCMKKYLDIHANDEYFTTFDEKLYIFIHYEIAKCYCEKFNITEKSWRDVYHRQ